MRCLAVDRPNDPCREPAEHGASQWPWFIIPVCEHHRRLVDDHYRSAYELQRRDKSVRSLAPIRKSLRAAGSDLKETSVRDQNSWVYFLRRQDGLIKIGTSKNVLARRRSLESAAGPLELLLTLPGDALVERAFHEKFQSDRVHGEWFEPSKKLLAFIEKRNHR